MKTDRELLELAAKAAGLILEYPDDYDGVFIVREEYRNGHIWNPLTDDGDALRLAVKLRIGTDFDSDKIYIHWPHHIVERRGEDPAATARRAIVRAAAAIGEGME